MLTTGHYAKGGSDPVWGLASSNHRRSYFINMETQLGLNVREKLGRSVFSIPPKNELRIQHEHEIENCIAE